MYKLSRSQTRLKLLKEVDDFDHRNSPVLLDGDCAIGPNGGCAHVEDTAVVLGVSVVAVGLVETPEGESKTG